VRFLKVFSFIFTTLLIILTITYSARVSVINNLAKAQLSSVQIKITCLDISFVSNMAIIVDKLCLQSPKANIEIVDMTIQWQYSPKIKITHIDVKLADIKGTDHLFSNTNHISQGSNQQSNEHGRNNQNLNQLLSTTLRPYIEKIKQFQLPIEINVSKLSYLPFAVINKLNASKSPAQQQGEIPYTANLSAVGNTFSFSLRNAEKIEFIKAKLTKNNKDFSIALSSKLNLLKKLASAHQLPISTELQSALNANDISGSVSSLIEYQADSLRMHNKITDIAIDFEDVNFDKGIGRSVDFTLIGALSFHSRLNLITDKSDAEIALTFVGKNEISLEYSLPQLFAMLEESEVSPVIISILKNNPLAYLTLKPQDNSTLILNNEKVHLSHIEISAHGEERIHQVKLDNIAFVMPHQNIAVNDNTISDSNNNTESNTENKIHKSEVSTKKTPNMLTVESFIIDSQLNLAGLSKFTSEPVTLHLEGSLKKAEKQAELNLTENSSITANNIVVRKQHSNVVKNTKEFLSLKTLTAKLEGKMQLLKGNALAINLKVHSQASQVNIPKKLQINSLDLFSKIKGNLDNIQFNTTALADGVNLGSIVITGPAISPKLQIAAIKLQLTDLLSLNMQLPTKIELIDGVLDYNISGQLADLSDIENTPFAVSVTVTSASGEVDGIWLQELNWQQHFTLLGGKITTQPNTSENLTVALIETPTPISKLSINTNWTFNKSFKLSASKLKADILGGSFSIPNIQWPIEHGHSVDVQLNSINLEQVLALDKKQGIVVTGNISGQIPVTFDGEKYIIEEGELHNISDGLIQVIDNPAVAELKASNSQLQLAFDALQNLHYHQLTSEVSMADDGYMLLETVIKGRNPDINNDVNLNLNLSYDLLGLLESLSITERFEESIIKGLQKNKE